MIDCCLFLLGALLCLCIFLLVVNILGVSMDILGGVGNEFSKAFDGILGGLGGVLPMVMLALIGATFLVMYRTSHSDGQYGPVPTAAPSGSAPLGAWPWQHLQNQVFLPSAPPPPGNAAAVVRPIQPGGAQDNKVRSAARS
mmetsp:Transcript_78420/g.196955  ORF Transcript_78420/g.196955 Transcript_78420/m.196955 type:complete len:141 (+) Transcript_78420:75-497(+)